MKNKKIKGIEQLKSRYGLMFISPWILGTIIFFFLPIGQSLFFSFCKVTLSAAGTITKFVGLENYKYIINVHPNYLNFMTESVTKIGYSLPVIVIISLILALILNQKFKGRIFFRALYFLPVIIASGVVIELLFSVNNSSDVSSIGMSEEVSSNMIDFTALIKNLGLPNQISKYLSVALENIFDLVWNSGIQIILFISGMQSIPDLLYEVAKVEGCTKWEEFWFITLPMLSRVLLLVVIFTIVELLTAKSNVLMALIVKTINNLEYGVGAAMAWLYFIVVGLVMTVVVYLLNRFWFRRWQ